MAKEQLTKENCLFVFAYIALCNSFLEEAFFRGFLTESFRRAGCPKAGVVCSALLFAVQILVVYHFSPLVDGVRLSRMQFLVVAVLSTALMLLFETPTWADVRAALPAIAYAGIFSSGIAYTLQILGQANVNPTVASLVMSLESVFSALSGWLILGERLSPRELLGSALMFAAIVLAQVEFRPKRS